MIILQTFELKVLVKDDSGPKKPKIPKLTMGIIFSSKRIIQQLREFILMLMERGEVDFLLTFDSTYRIMVGNWTLIDGGSLATFSRAAGPMARRISNQS